MRPHATIPWILVLALATLISPRPAAAGPILLAMENTLNGSVQEFDPSTGASLGTFATLQPDFVTFSGIAAGNGNVYLAEVRNGSNTVFAYSESGVELGSFAVGGNTLEDMAIGLNGNLFVMQQFQNSPFQGFITEYDPATGVTIPFPQPGSGWAGVGANAQSMALAPNGNVALGDQAGIEVYTAGDVLLDQISSPGGTPFGLYITPAGDIFTTGGANLGRCPGCQAGTPGVSLAGFFGADPNNGTLSGVIGSPDGAQIFATSLFAGTILKFDAATGAYEGILASTGSGTALKRLALIDTAQSTAPEPAGAMMIAAAGLAGAIAGWRRKAAVRAE